MGAERGFPKKVNVYGISIRKPGPDCADAGLTAVNVERTKVARVAFVIRMTITCFICFFSFSCFQGQNNSRRTHPDGRVILLRATRSGAANWSGDRGMTAHTHGSGPRLGG